ncbi:uncharacterized protein PFL1_02247 [Pseudozyma flocculosa PF-1]|nr:uncharacterized protein PFL1_02247 [Pseudozyma flocculosa PF-1]EPQ30130.1 hypothetical protein PFL1_02247 [Pseudozyma flocculosa PF-1]
MDSLSNLRNSLDDADYSSNRPDGSDAARGSGSPDIASLERKRRQRHLDDHEQELTKQFKAAALQLTTLYRSSLSSNTSSYEAGYRHALSHILELVQRPPAAAEDPEGPQQQQQQQQQQSEALDSLSPEQGIQRLRWLAGYLQRRIEAMSTQDDDDDAGASMPSRPSPAATQTQQQRQSSRPARFEGADPISGQRHGQQHSGAPSPLGNTAALPSPPASSVRFGSHPASSSNSPAPRSGFGTPIPPATAPTDSEAAPAASARTSVRPASSGNTFPGGRSAEASSSATVLSAPSTNPPTPSNLGGGGGSAGTKRTRGESSTGGIVSHLNDGDGNDTTGRSSAAADLNSAHRRRIGGRRTASGLAAASSSSAFGPSHAVPGSIGHVEGPLPGLLPPSLRSGSFDFKLPQSVGVRSVDFSHNGMAAAAAAATAAKLNAGRRQGGGAAPGSTSTKRGGSHGTAVSSVRRGRSGRLRLAGGLRAGTTAHASTSGEHDMATDSDDDWVDDDSEQEGGASAPSAAASGAVSNGGRHAHSRGGGRAKRRRTARAPDASNTEPDGDEAHRGGDHEAGDIDM